MNIKKTAYISLGFISLMLGALGVFLPILPSVPFLLLSLVCFTRSSERLKNWFISTKLYKNNLESYIKNGEMTKTSKVKTLVTISIIMGFGFFIMMRKNLIIPCIILFTVWVAHIIYFTFRVRTSK